LTPRLDCRPAIPRLDWRPLTRLDRLSPTLLFEASPVPPSLLEARPGVGAGVDR
jgi:hypothetical protein